MKSVFIAKNSVEISRVESVLSSAGIIYKKENLTGSDNAKGYINTSYGSVEFFVSDSDEEKALSLIKTIIP